MGLKEEGLSQNDHVDVIIVGAGPAGLMASLWMAELGIKTRIIDKRGTRTLHGGADGIHVRSMEIWESFDMVDTVLKHGFGVNEWCLWAPDDDGELHRKQRKCALGTDLSRFPIGMMHQGHIEATMIDAIRRRRGAEVERGTVPTAISVDHSSINDALAYPVKVSIRRLRKEELDKTSDVSHIKTLNGKKQPARPSIDFPACPDDSKDIVNSIGGEEGSSEIIHAKYLIGADGAKSWVREHLRVNMSGSVQDTVWGVVDLRPMSDFPDIRKNTTVQSQNGTLLMIPREHGLVRIYVMLREDPSDESAFGAIIDNIKDIMSPFNFDYNYCDWWTVYRVTQQLSDSYCYKDRVYLAGDAVHTHTPRGGQGMNVSMQDTYNLGWKLGLVLKGHADKLLLTTYEKERRQVAKALIELDTDLSRVMARDTADFKPEDTQRIYERLRDYGSGVNIRYEPSIVNVNPFGPPRSTLQVGERFPNLRVYRQATGVPAEVQQLLKSDGRWRLLVITGAVSKHLQMLRVNALGAQLAELVHKYPPVQKGKPFLDVLLIHASRESEVEITDFHKTFFSFDEENGWDYDRVFTRITDGPHSDAKYVRNKNSPSFSLGCMAVIRPDQHAGWLGHLDEYDLLEQYFQRFLIPVARDENGESA